MNVVSDNPGEVIYGNDIEIMKQALGMDNSLTIEALDKTAPNYKTYKIFGKNIVVDGKKFPAVAVDVFDSNEKNMRACELTKRTTSAFLKCVHVWYKNGNQVQHRTYVVTKAFEDEDEAFKTVEKGKKEMSAWQRFTSRFSSKNGPRRSWGETLNSWRPWGGKRRRKKGKRTRRR